MCIYGNTQYTATRRKSQKDIRETGRSERKKKKNKKTKVQFRKQTKKENGDPM